MTSRKADESECCERSVVNIGYRFRVFLPLIVFFAGLPSSGLRKSPDRLETSCACSGIRTARVAIGVSFCLLDLSILNFGINAGLAYAEASAWQGRPEDNRPIKKSEARTQRSHAEGGGAAVSRREWLRTITIGSTQQLKSRARC